MISWLRRLARRAIRVFRPAPSRPAAAARPGPARTPRIQSREELHAHWRNPDGLNRPEDYLEPTARSRYLLDLIRPYVGEQPHILEIGCNVGRNLAHLFDAGYRDLAGIEINTDALAKLREAFPELGATADLMNAPVEDVIRGIPDGSFDLVYAMAVLEHIHPDSEWIFGEMVRITRGSIVTIEDEKGVSSHHVPRDYQVVFEGLGLRQVRSQSVGATEGFPTDFEARVFTRPASGT